MNKKDILERNLLALSVNNPELCGQIGSVQPCRHITFIQTAKGLPVPARSDTPRPLPLHSTIDPEKEGNRISILHRGAGYLVFLGIGGAYHIRPFLEHQEVSRILIIDKDLSMLRALLEKMDLRSILLDPRVHLLIQEDPEHLIDFFLSDYLPAIHGDLRIIPLRAMFESEPEYFQNIMDIIKSVIGKIADDYTVQAHFGKKWFVNTLSNLAAAEKSTVSITPVRKAIVTGAGPSLELQINRLEELKKEAILIASDTSMPALIKYGIEPDLVISIDCQQISYHHFLQGMPSNVPLVLDLASPPVLTRLTEKTIFFSSGHPFSQYVSTHWRRFPYIDTSGGNVSQAAISLAHFLGADEIYLLGTDFSFPEGKSYSRGTYIYPLFRSQETHLDPLETLFFSFILKNSSIIKERVEGSLRYTTRPMIGYKERLEDFLCRNKVRVIPLPGKGVPLKIPEIDPAPKALKRSKIIGSILSAGAPETDWRSFLKSYLSKVKALPNPYYPLSRYFRELADSDQALWITQYPAAAALREKELAKGITSLKVLERVHEWTVSVTERYLNI